MSDILEYKGYHTRISFIAESKTLRGKIEGISDFVDFETDNPNEVEKEFHMAVDDYLDFCNEVGKVPEKEYKGSFNVRIPSELHRKLANLAFKNNCSLNAEVEKAISYHVENNSNPVTQPTWNSLSYTEMHQMNQSQIENDKKMDSNVIPFSNRKSVHYNGVKTS